MKKVPEQEYTADFQEQAVGGKNFVAAYERIAVFDKGGPRWAEHPVYFQAPFLAPTHEPTVYPTLECT